MKKHAKRKRNEPTGSLPLAPCSAFRALTLAGDALVNYDPAIDNLMELVNDWKAAKDALAPINYPLAYMWADYDPHASSRQKWCTYGTKAEQRDNRPDLNPVRVAIVAVKPNHPVDRPPRGPV